MSHTEIRDRLQAAMIPSHAYNITLSRSGQTALRGVIHDRMYQSQGLLQSISLISPVGMQSSVFNTICARFAAELCIVGQSVLHVGVHTLRRELQRYASGGDHRDALHPVLTHKGFLYLTGLDSGSGRGDVLDYLTEFVSLGGALIVPLARDESGLLPPISPAMDALLHYSLRVPVSDVPAAQRTGSNV